MGTPRASPLAAAYLKYAWTQPCWVPRLRGAALHLDLFEEPEKRGFASYEVTFPEHHRAHRSLAEGDRALPVL